MDGFNCIHCAFLRTNIRLLFSWGGELCVDSRISSYRNKYRISVIWYIKLSSKHFLPCANGQQKSKQVLPNINKTLTNPPEKGCCIINLQTGWGAIQREFAAKIHSLTYREANTVNALPSTLVYDPLSSRTTWVQNWTEFLTYSLTMPYGWSVLWWNKAFVWKRSFSCARVSGNNYLRCWLSYWTKAALIQEAACDSETS